MRPHLLCTFTTLQQLPTVISNVHKFYSNDVANLKCYSYVHDNDYIICVYNVFVSDKRMRDTISINRKKESNTLYSINALNALISHLNNGVLDKSFIIDWSNYKNTLLLSQGEYGFKTISIKELSN